jgi:mRNA deadenylase 3'-5' endonuclease subunit Ccr4
MAMRPGLSLTDQERLRKDNVAVIAALVMLTDEPTPAPRVVLVANTHFFWNPFFEDVKLRQAQYLTQKLNQVRTQVSALLQEAHRVFTLIPFQFVLTRG